MKSFKLITSLIFAVSLTACSGVDNIEAGVQDDSYDALSSKSFTASPDTSIAPQITANKLQETDWGVSVKALPVTKTVKKATLLSYMGFDNDKGGYRDELRQMVNFHEYSGTSSLMNMLLQTDSADGKDLKRYLVVNDSDASKMVSPYLSFKYERDSADYRVLQAFIKWGFSTYPSKIKMLDIDSHGGGFLGVVRDDSSGNLISLPNLAKALKSTGQKIDVLNFDACLMGAIEVLYELKDVTDVMIGSQDSTLGTGMLYTKALPAIVNNAKTADEIARNIVLASDRSGTKDFLVRPNRKGKMPQIYTIAAFKAKAVDNLATEMNKLSKLLLANMSTQKSAIKSALTGTHALYVDEDDLGGERDLHEVLQRIGFVVQDPAVKTQVQMTTQALNKAILIARKNNAEKYAQGMAINISPNHMTSKEYQATMFAKNTSWDEMIIATNK